MRTSDVRRMALSVPNSPKAQPSTDSRRSSQSGNSPKGHQCSSPVKSSPSSPKVTAAPEQTLHIKHQATGQDIVAKFCDIRTSKAVAILCHGYASTSNHPLLRRIARELQSRAKLSTLRVDFRGNGESGGAFSFAGYQSEVSDLRHVATHVTEKLRRKVAAIIGHSKGGDVVLLYASTYDEVPLIVNIAGRFDLKRGFRERLGDEVIAKVQRMGQIPQTVVSDAGDEIEFLLTKRDIEERMTLNIGHECKKITIGEVLTVHGTLDKVIPVEDAHEFAKCIRQHQLFLVDGADHNFTNAQHAEAASRQIVDFIQGGILTLK